uniref:Tail protein n=2 Tax=viral metagenome TaxID=1070528 RepID=A0A6M3K656_9ZZZZ
MLRNWSAKSINLFYVDQDTLTCDGSSGYTMGSGGDVDTVRPSSIRGAYISGGGRVDIIDEGQYRRISLKSTGGPVSYIWYNPEYPLGVLYPWPLGSDTIILDSLKPLTDPATITTDVAFPPEYDEAIVFNLAIRLAPEYGVSIGQETAAIAISALDALQNENFASQIVSIRPEIIRATRNYNIEKG